MSIANTRLSNWAQNQAVRTSQGRIRVFPCSVEGKDNPSGYELVIIRIIGAVYDNARAYSLRDRDDAQEDIEDWLPLVKFRLSCRAAENFLYIR